MHERHRPTIRMFDRSQAGLRPVTVDGSERGAEIQSACPRRSIQASMNAINSASCSGSS